MKTEDLFPSRFVTAEDIVNDKIVTVERVVLEEVFDVEKNLKTMKPIVYFKGATKGMLLNKTNWKKIAKVYGHESDDWTGKKVTITAIEVMAFGDIVRALRIKMPAEK